MSTDRPARTEVTGTSSFLPVRVCGMAGATMSSSGTWRGESGSGSRRPPGAQVVVEFGSGDEGDEQRHPIRAVGAVDAQDERLGDLVDALDHLVDVGRSHPDAWRFNVASLRPWMISDPRSVTVTQSPCRQTGVVGPTELHSCSK